MRAFTKHPAGREAIVSRTFSGVSLFSSLSSLASFVHRNVIIGEISIILPRNERKLF